MSEKRWADAAAALRKAVELSPENATTRLNLGTSLYMTNDAAGALKEYEAAVRLSPGLADAHFAIGVLMQESGRDHEAIAAFAKAVQAQPDADEMRLSLADALRRTGRDRESLPHYVQIVKKDPSASQAVFGHAIALVRLRQYVEARDRLSSATKMFPDQPGFAHALARLLAAAPDDRVRNGARALRLLDPVAKSGPSVPVAETMAMALAEVGRFDEATQWQRRALEMAQTGGRRDLAARLMANLELYQRRQPCRTPWTDDDPVFHPRPTQ
jgi:tetratricopeptide (TPR) repeat protein